MNLLSRVEKLEEEYLINKMEAPKFIIKFVSPINKDKVVNKLSNDGVIYERMPDEKEDDFIKRIAGLNKDNLIFNCD